MKRMYFRIFISVIVGVLLIKFTLIPVIDSQTVKSMAPSIEEYNQNLSKGVFYLLQQELQHIPPAGWNDHIEKRQKHFGYPLSIRNYHDINLTEQQNRHLLDGEIVILELGKLFWQRIGDSDFVIGMGPIPEIKPSIPARIIAWLAITALIGTVLLVWVFFLWRRLMKIIATTRDFGNGDFDVRVNISRRSSLAPLASAFNNMADRIQGLIRSHKELTNAVSHELRTPISRIRFGLEMLRTAPDKKGISLYSKGIKKDVDELDELVNELLTYARFDRESMALQTGEHEISAWMEEILTSIEPLPLTIQQANLLDNKRQNAVFDPRQMRRAVINLLQNAARYGNGNARLTLEQEKDNIMIHIDDNGPGILTKDRERIFEPFTRLDASRNKETGGFGLGLAIVKQIAICHGGSATVLDSNMGGSRFSIKWKGVI